MKILEPIRHTFSRTLFEYERAAEAEKTQDFCERAADKCFGFLRKSFGNSYKVSDETLIHKPKLAGIKRIGYGILTVVTCPALLVGFSFLYFSKTHRFTHLIMTAQDHFENREIEKAQNVTVKALQLNPKQLWARSFVEKLGWAKTRYWKNGEKVKANKKPIAAEKKQEFQKFRALQHFAYQTGSRNLNIACKTYFGSIIQKALSKDKHAFEKCIDRLKGIPITNLVDKWNGDLKLEHIEYLAPRLTHLQSISWAKYNLNKCELPVVANNLKFAHRYCQDLYQRECENNLSQRLSAALEKKSSKFQEIIDKIKNIPVEYLNFSNSQHLTGDHLKKVAKLPFLKVLNLTGCQNITLGDLTDNFAKHPSLVTLFLQGSSATKEFAKADWDDLKIKARCSVAAPSP